MEHVLTNNVAGRQLLASCQIFMIIKFSLSLVNFASPGQSLMIWVFTCLIFAFPNQVWIIFLVPRVFENFENRFAGQKRGLWSFSGLADPKFGFRQCKIWVTQVWPNGPGGTLIWVPSVYFQGAASELQNFWFSFSPIQHWNIQIQSLGRKPLLVMCLA